GQRRVGKSYFLFQIMDFIKNRNPEANIIYVNKELVEFDGIKNYLDLVQYVDSQLVDDKKHYIFIDEIQDIAEFERALRSWQAENRHDIYVTGSNAFLLSGELATYLSGRYIAVRMYTLSYAEFLQFHKLEETNDAFMLYLRYGGLPYLLNLNFDDITVFEYLRNIYMSILFKDVMARHEIRNVALLENLVKLLADCAGSAVSAKSISDFLKSQRMNISPSIILNYLSHLEQAFFVTKVSRMEIQGRKQLEVGQKYFFEDLGLRNAMVGYKQTDIGKMLENLVYLHLCMAGFKVFVGKNNTKEIDFLAEKEGERLYVQVAYLISDESTKEREFGNLLEIKDNYPKLVVTMDEGARGNYLGIRHLHIRDFLLGKY
ncbi:MAG: ATP-binding protein, partial [Cytophagales bacterium]